MSGFSEVRLFGDIRRGPVFGAISGQKVA